MKKPKTKKQLEMWQFTNFKGEVVTINELTEVEAKAHLYQFAMAMEKQVANAYRTIDVWEKLL